MSPSSNKIRSSTLSKTRLTSSKVAFTTSAKQLFRPCDPDEDDASSLLNMNDFHRGDPAEIKSQRQLPTINSFQVDDLSDDMRAPALSPRRPAEAAQADTTANHKTVGPAEPPQDKKAPVASTTATPESTESTP